VTTSKVDQQGAELERSIRAPSRSLGGWRTGIAVSSGVLWANWCNSSPYLVGTLVEGFNHSAAQAGYILGVEMACYSVALL